MFRRIVIWAGFSLVIIALYALEADNAYLVIHPSDTADSVIIENGLIFIAEPDFPGNQEATRKIPQHTRHTSHSNIGSKSKKKFPRNQIAKGLYPPGKKCRQKSTRSQWITAGGKTTGQTGKSLHSSTANCRNASKPAAQDIRPIHTARITATPR